MTPQRRAVGRAGEDAAARWYEARGFTVLARNWQVREGEIDLVARRGGLLVFCEVKARSSNAFGSAAEAVTYRKQQRIRRLALRYLAEHNERGEIRFDVATAIPGALGPTVEVIEAAF